ncbi:MAG TPA: hypothetical protein VEQ60_11865 [Longimicrobium sp.]|nr:hypothetical protein [Longimicrobium sp.]
MAEFTSPRLIDVSRAVSPDTLLGLVPEGRITACDFYVSGAETGVEVPGGYQLGRILNIDHHAPATRMARQVSSTNLALTHLAESGQPVSEGAVVINHTDCDSVLSAALLCGLLEPDARYGTAAIAADHTGEENPIADLLQALDPLRDFEFSMSSLTRLEQGRPLSPTAAEMVSRRALHRQRAAEFVAGGAFERRGCLAFASLPERIDSTFLPALLPDACVILVFLPTGVEGHREAKLRLGLAAPPGLTLHDLRIEEFDPAFGGRWNAGANRRAGGTTLPIEAYVAALEQRLTRALV